MCVLWEIGESTSQKKKKKASKKKWPGNFQTFELGSLDVIIVEEVGWYKMSSLVTSGDLQTPSDQSSTQQTEVGSYRRGNYVFKPSWDFVLFPRSQLVLLLFSIVMTLKKVHGPESPHPVTWKQ